MLSLVLLLACHGGSDSGAADSGASPDGVSWTPVLVDDPRGAFLAAWGPAPDDVWIVGGQPDAGVVLRGDADGLAEVALPAGTPLLNWVHGTGADDVWVAGIHGTLLHWDGADWTDHSLGVEEAVWGVYAASPDRAWAVGGESGFGGERAGAWSWDGAAWSTIALPDGVDGASNLFKVHHDGTDLWMVGVGGVALRGDGAAMAQVATGTAMDLVTANRPAAGGPLVVVGGRGTGVVLEVGGEGLVVTAQAPAGLNGVAVLDDGRAVVVGERGWAGVYDTADDSLVEGPVDTLDVLHNAFVAPDGGLWAVGGNLYTAGDSFLGSAFVGTLP